MPPLSAEVEVSQSSPSHCLHLLQRDKTECTDQVSHCVVWERHHMTTKLYNISISIKAAELSSHHAITAVSTVADDPFHPLMHFYPHAIWQKILKQTCHQPLDSAWVFFLRQSDYSAPCCLPMITWASQIQARACPVLQLHTCTLLQ